MSDLEHTKPTIYFAAPVRLYSSHWHDAAVPIVRRLFPDHRVVVARDSYHSTEDWLRKWPTILPQLQMLIFIADYRGIIGRGVWREVMDMQEQARPVYLLDQRLRLPVPLKFVRLVTCSIPTNQRYACATVLPELRAYIDLLRSLKAS